MIALLEKTKMGYVAQFERHFMDSVEKVWEYLTENEKLVKWFSELSVEDLRKGGIIKFDMQDGTFEEMKITDFELKSVLEYTWGEDLVRFELFKEGDGCRLLLKESMHEINSHTPKDLAGWHVCLDVIGMLLKGKTFESREEEWKKWYEKYVEAVEKVTKTS